MNKEQISKPNFDWNVLDTWKPEDENGIKLPEFATYCQDMF